MPRLSARQPANTLFPPAVAEETAMRRRMILRQGIAHAWAVAGSASFFRLLARCIKEAGVLAVFRQWRRGYRRRLPQEKKNTSANQDKNKVEEPKIFFLTGLCSHETPVIQLDRSSGIKDGSQPTCATAISRRRKSTAPRRSKSKNSSARAWGRMRPCPVRAATLRCCLCLLTRPCSASGCGAF